MNKNVLRIFEILSNVLKSNANPIIRNSIIKNMKILIFTEGTALKPGSVESHKAHTFRSYIPNGNVVRKLQSWKKQGADIYYLTSRTTTDEINDIRYVLEKYTFPQVQNLLFRKEGQAYKDVAELLIPIFLLKMIVQVSEVNGR